MENPDAIFGVAPADGKTAQRAEAEAQRSAPSAPPPADAKDGGPTTPMRNLANLVMRVFRDAWDFRNSSGVTDRLDYALLVNRMEFSAKQKDSLAQQFGPESDIPSVLRSAVSSVKFRAGRSHLVDLLNQSGEPLFHFEPSPVPDTGNDVFMKAIRATAVEVAALIDELDRMGVANQPAAADISIKIQDLVDKTMEHHIDDFRNKADEEARERCRLMERKVWDIMEEGGFHTEFYDFITNICVCGTGVMVGPVMRNVARNAVKEQGDSRAKVYRRKVKCIPVFESVNPLDCYPAPNAKDIEDGPLCITVKFSGEELYRFASSAKEGKDFGGGWVGTEVNDLLRRHSSGGVKLDIVSFDPERRLCENNGFTDIADYMFEGVRCFMPVRGSELIDMGIVRDLDRKDIDPIAFYRTETIIIDNRVVYVCIHPDELGVPVSKACFYSVPGSWWGESIADKLKQCQCILDNTAKSILLNESMTSSPMGYVNDVSRLTDKSPTALKFRAGKIFGFTNESRIGVGAQAGAPIGVLPVNSALNELLAIWKAFQQQADQDSGIPAYSEGQAAGASGALRTAQGLNTFVENTMRGFKMVMTGIDHDFISRAARMTADWVLLYDNDPAVKGDVYVRSVGLIGRVLKVQRDAARLQLLNMCLNSQVLTQTIGVKGIVEMFRPSIADLDLNPDDIIPNKYKIEQQDLLMQLAQLTQASGGQTQEQPLQQGGGMQPGVSPVAETMPAGAVAERRGVA